MVLADMGADVVKIEDPTRRRLPARVPACEGRHVAAAILAVNRGKRSLALDLKAPARRDAFLKMVEHADVVVESFRPGVMDKLGVGYAALAARNPKIVVCSISGYGQTGPYVERAGHDLNYIALAGVLAMTGAAPAARRRCPACRSPISPAVRCGARPRSSARSSAATAPARARTSTSR